MSRETLKWLRTNVRVGFASERPDGPAWWAAENYMADGSHFDGPVPAGEVRRLLAVPFVAAEVTSTYTVTDHARGCDGEFTAERGESCGDECITVRHTVTDPNKKSIVSPDDGHVHGYFAPGWNLHGYQQWTADQLAAILDQTRDELAVSSVGLLQKRSVAFIQARLTGSGLEVGGYEATPYIFAATSVNGSLASTYGTGVTGWVCDNTMAAGLAEARKTGQVLKIKHSSKSAGRIQEIRDYLSLAYQAGDEFTETARVLQATDVTPADFRAWLDLKAPVSAPDPKSSTGGAKYTNAVKFRDTLTEMWTYDPKVKPWNGTAFGIWQLDNTYRTWKRGVSGADGGRMERNLVNLVSGISAREDRDAMRQLATVMGDRFPLAIAAK